MKHRKFFRIQLFTQRMPPRNDLRGTNWRMRELLEVVRFSSGAGPSAASPIPWGF
jgi:hypothetical protein